MHPNKFGHFLGLRLKAFKQAGQIQPKAKPDKSGSAEQVRLKAKADRDPFLKC